MQKHYMKLRKQGKIRNRNNLHKLLINSKKNSANKRNKRQKDKAHKFIIIQAINKAKEVSQKFKEFKNSNEQVGSKINNVNKNHKT